MNAAVILRRISAWIFKRMRRHESGVVYAGPFCAERDSIDECSLVSFLIGSSIPTVSSFGREMFVPSVMALEDLNTSTLLRRAHILEVLEETGVIGHEEAEAIEASPRDMALASSVPVNNYLFLPEDVGADNRRHALTSCFVDYLNFVVEDVDDLKTTLESSVTVSNCDAACVASVVAAVMGPDFSLSVKVKHLLEVIYDESCYGKAVFYSFCLGRAVMLQDIQHCSTCHRCHDWRYSRCPDCGRCSLGVGSGMSVCEHCGHTEAYTPISAASVGSASDLFSEEDCEEADE